MPYIDLKTNFFFFRIMQRMGKRRTYIYIKKKHPEKKGSIISLQYVK
jgi:hypothetical protein